MQIKPPAISRYILVLAGVFLAHNVMATSLLSIFPKGDKPSAFVFFPLTILALFIALAVHEMGHLLTGLAKGFRFELFVVGLLGIKRTDQGVKFYLNKDIGMMGGVAATIPVRQSRDNRKKFALMVLAGPLSSLLFGLLAFVILNLCTSGAARGFWLVAGACSVGLVLATTLPRKTGIFFTDRTRFQRLMSKGKVGEIEEALLTMMAQYTIDQSSKNIDITLARLVQTDEEAFMRFWGYYYEYQYYKDNALEKETEVAKYKLLAVKADMSPQVWKMLKIDEAA